MVTEQAKETEKQVEEPVSEETETVSEKQEKPEGEVESKDETITFTSQTELEEHTQKRIASEANRIANVSTVALQSEKDKLFNEVARLTRQAEHKGEDSKLGKLERKESDDWKTESSGDVTELHEVRRDVVSQGRKVEEREIEVTAKEKELTRVGLRQNAFEVALKRYLPEDAEFISDINAYVEKLQKAKTEEEIKLLDALEDVRIKAKSEVKPKRTKPDTNVPTAPGGTDASKATGRELINKGLKDF